MNSIKSHIRQWIQYIWIKKSGFFDPVYYLLSYPDVRHADIDPLSHFIQFGWKEGRNPSLMFDTGQYLAENTDVRKADVNPLFHYIRFGKKEGRLPRKASIKETTQLPKSKKDYQPKVSVIVPNYNHEKYLEKRLSSIYSQTYSNYDVFLLDDCSTDNSRSILQKYQNEHPENTILLINSINQGSAFSQWKKGISSADGDLIWIAESDDYCDPDFLEKLVPFFEDETVLLGYAHSVFVDENGNKHGFTFESYLSDISKEKWNISYIETSHNEVRSALGLRNSIPNVSGVVFRKPDGYLPILDDPDWINMRICGDWLFYLHILRGGRIAFCADVHNYFRIHQESSSKKTHVQDIYYKEHEKVACTIARLYNVPDELLIRNQTLIKDFYLKNVEHGTLTHFNKLFDINKVFEDKKKRTPNILMAIYAFWFGGGEIFPIRLANAYKQQGMSVLLFNGGYEPENPEVRKMVSPLIPVITYRQDMDVNKIISDYGIELSHTHHAYLDYMFTVAKTNSSMPLKQVITMHGMYEMMGDAFKRNVLKVIKEVDAWFYLADKNIAPFKEYGFYKPDKFFKVDNGMKAPALHPANLAELGIGPDAIVVCVASRALPEKGWPESMEAIEHARELTGKDIHLLLIGEGPIYEQLRTKAIQPFIHLLGFKPNVVDYIAASNIGLVPSYFPGESYPLVIIECFMAGRPIITSNIGETARMISIDGIHSGGILVNLRDGKITSEDLSLALIRMINDDDYYQRCSDATNILKERFNIDRISAEYLHVYESLLSS